MSLFTRVQIALFLALSSASANAQSDLSFSARRDADTSAVANERTIAQPAKQPNCTPKADGVDALSWILTASDGIERGDVPGIQLAKVDCGTAWGYQWSCPDTAPSCRSNSSRRCL